MSVEVHNPYEAGAQVVLRPIKSEDVALVTNSWLTSYRDSCHVWGVPDQSYFWCMHKVLETLIPRSAVVMAVLEDDPNTILGWVAYEMADSAMILHYLYVKKAFRGMKIAKKLFQTVYEIENEPPVVIFTARTKHSWSIWEKKLRDSTSPLFVYNPYLQYNQFNDWSLDVNLLRRHPDDREDR